MVEKVDALRVVQDPTYAASLTDADWQALALDPAWNELVGEFHEMVAPVLARYGARLGIPAPRPVTPAPQESARTRPDGFQVIGKRVPRLHGLGIVTNLGQYTQNLRMPGMLHTRTLRSPHPHGRVKSVDTKKAEALSGVVAVLHRGNLPAAYRDVKLGSGPPDRFLFNEEVFEVGAPIAIVAAESEHIADQAIRLIAVEYEVLPAVLDMMDGARPSALKQWDNKENGTIVAVTPPLVRGNPDTARADTTIEAVLTKSTEQHVALELTSSLMYWDHDRLIAYYTNQHAHGSRAGLSQALKLPANHVRVIQTGYMGSGYGYRSGIDLTEVHTAILAKMTGRPVKTLYTREEDFVTRTHRPAFRNEMKLGVNRD
ncbi:MAG: molybdopterin-dependent oxidoreductase, partial [Acidobacteria bacterium]|nr:molybdopterin-dependent oxidoreductase [Acidobacteriota bacterium]